MMIRRIGGGELMSNTFCINKSGLQVPIYSEPEAITQVGTLYNREAFGYNRNWGGDDVHCNIRFRTSSGYVTGGFLVNPPSGAMTECTDYVYSNVVIYEKKLVGNYFAMVPVTYLAFYIRSSRVVYDVNGTPRANVPSGKLVACRTALAGDNHPEWKAINYYQNSAGSWQQVNFAGHTYGFVDTGLADGSGYNSIPMYGSW